MFPSNKIRPPKEIKQGLVGYALDELIYRYQARVELALPFLPASFINYSFFSHFGITLSGLLWD